MASAIQKTTGGAGPQGPVQISFLDWYQFKFSKSRLRMAMEVVNAIMSLLSVGVYIYDTYVPAPDATRIIYFICSITFSIEYVARLFAAKNLLRYLLWDFSVIDLVTIVFGFLYFALDEFGSGLGFIRVLRIIQVVRLLKALTSAVLRFSRRSSQPMQLEYVRRSVELALTMVGVVFISGCVFYELEVESQALDLHTAVYWACVTIATIGYGDYAPTTVASQLLFPFIILMIVLVLPQKISNLSEVMLSFNRYMRASFTAQRFGLHVVLTGHVTFVSAQTFIGEFFHPDRGYQDLDIIMLRHREPEPQLVITMNNPQWERRVKYLQGSAFRAEDLARSDAGRALAIFVMANKFASDPAAEDRRTLLTVLAIGQYLRQFSEAGGGRVPRVVSWGSTSWKGPRSMESAKGKDANVNHPHIVVQFLLNATLDNAIALLQTGMQHPPELGISPLNISPFPVCVGHLRASLLGASLHTPGLITLISNLCISCSMERKTLFGVEDISLLSSCGWLSEYLHGAGVEIYDVVFPESYHGLTFKEAALQLWREEQVILIGLRFPNHEDERQCFDVKMAPLADWASPPANPYDMPSPGVVPGVVATGANISMGAMGGFGLAGGGSGGGPGMPLPHSSSAASYQGQVRAQDSRRVIDAHTIGYILNDDALVLGSATLGFKSALDPHDDPGVMRPGAAYHQQQMLRTSTLRTGASTPSGRHPKRHASANHLNSFQCAEASQSTPHAPSSGNLPFVGGGPSAPMGHAVGSHAGGAGSRAGGGASAVPASASGRMGGMLTQLVNSLTRSGASLVRLDSEELQRAEAAQGPRPEGVAARGQGPAPSDQAVEGQGLGAAAQPGASWQLPLPPMSEGGPGADSPETARLAVAPRAGVAAAVSAIARGLSAKAAPLSPFSTAPAGANQTTPLAPASLSPGTPHDDSPDRFHNPLFSALYDTRGSSSQGSVRSRVTASGGGAAVGPRLEAHAEPLPGAIGPEGVALGAPGRGMGAALGVALGEAAASGHWGLADSSTAVAQGDGTSRPEAWARRLDNSGARSSSGAAGSGGGAVSDANSGASLPPYNPAAGRLRDGEEAPMPPATARPSPAGFLDLQAARAAAAAGSAAAAAAGEDSAGGGSGSGGGAAGGSEAERTPSGGMVQESLLVPGGMLPALPEGRFRNARAGPGGRGTASLEQPFLHDSAQVQVDLPRVAGLGSTGGGGGQSTAAADMQPPPSTAAQAGAAPTAVEVASILDGSADLSLGESAAGGVAWPSAPRLFHSARERRRTAPNRVYGALQEEDEEEEDALDEKGDRRMGLREGAPRSGQRSGPYPRSDPGGSSARSAGGEGGALDGEGDGGGSAVAGVNGGLTGPLVTLQRQRARRRTGVELWGIARESLSGSASRAGSAASIALGSGGRGIAAARGGSSNPGLHAVWTGDAQHYPQSSASLALLPPHGGATSPPVAFSGTSGGTTVTAGPQPLSQLRLALGRGGAGAASGPLDAGGGEGERTSRSSVSRSASLVAPSSTQPQGSLRPSRAASMKLVFSGSREVATTVEPGRLPGRPSGIFSKGSLSRASAALVDLFHQPKHHSGGSTSSGAAALAAQGSGGSNIGAAGPGSPGKGGGSGGGAKDGGEDRGRQGSGGGPLAGATLALASSVTPVAKDAGGSGARLMSVLHNLRTNAAPTGSQGAAAPGAGGATKTARQQGMKVSTNARDLNALAAISSRTYKKVATKGRLLGSRQGSRVPAAQAAAALAAQQQQLQLNQHNNHSQLSRGTSGPLPVVQLRPLTVTTLADKEPLDSPVIISGSSCFSQLPQLVAAIRSAPPVGPSRRFRTCPIVIIDDSKTNPNNPFKALLSESMLGAIGRVPGAQPHLIFVLRCNPLHVSDLEKLNLQQGGMVNGLIVPNTELYSEEAVVGSEPALADGQVLLIADALRCYCEQVDCRLSVVSEVLALLNCSYALPLCLAEGPYRGGTHLHTMDVGSPYSASMGRSGRNAFSPKPDSRRDTHEPDRLLQLQQSRQEAFMQHLLSSAPHLAPTLAPGHILMQNFMDALFCQTIFNPMMLQILLKMLYCWDEPDELHPHPVLQMPPLPPSLQKEPPSGPPGPWSQQQKYTALAQPGPCQPQQASPFHSCQQQQGQRALSGSSSVMQQPSQHHMHPLGNSMGRSESGATASAPSGPLCGDVLSQLGLGSGHAHPPAATSSGGGGGFETSPQRMDRRIGGAFGSVMGDSMDPRSSGMPAPAPPTLSARSSPDRGLQEEGQTDGSDEGGMISGPGPLVEAHTRRSSISLTGERCSGGIAAPTLRADPAAVAGYPPPSYHQAGQPRVSPESYRLARPPLSPGPVTLPPPPQLQLPQMQQQQQGSWRTRNPSRTRLSCGGATSSPAALASPSRFQLQAPHTAKQLQVHDELQHGVTLPSPLGVSVPFSGAGGTSSTQAPMQAPSVLSGGGMATLTGASASTTVRIFCFNFATLLDRVNGLAATLRYTQRTMGQQAAAAAVDVSVSGQHVRPMATSGGGGAAHWHPRAHGGGLDTLGGAVPDHWEADRLSTGGGGDGLTGLGYGAEGEVLGPYGLGQRPVPAITFGTLFEVLVSKYDMLPLGLYRRDNGNDAKIEPASRQPSRQPSGVNFGDSVPVTGTGTGGGGGGGGKERSVKGSLLAAAVDALMRGGRAGDARQRSPCRSPSQRSSPKRPGSGIPYVYTKPARDTSLRSSDDVYLLASAAVVVRLLGDVV